MLPSRRLSASLAALLALLAPACAAQDSVPAPQTEEPSALGLMGTIPIFWGEADGLGEMLAGEATQHWTRARLERDYRLQPLDTLDEASLMGLEYLLMAQPRPLSAAENVALDRWVRAGGRLLLFADPFLTSESRFSIGDRRRPQDVILLSPILAHWGLDLQFDDDQPPGRQMREFAGGPMVVNLPGQFATGSQGAGCSLRAEGLVADCRLGSGRAVILADAALLDLHDPHSTAPDAFDRLLRIAFGSDGESPVDASVEQRSSG